MVAAHLCCEVIAGARGLAKLRNIGEGEAPRRQRRDRRSYAALVHVFDHLRDRQSPCAGDGAAPLCRMTSSQAGGKKWWCTSMRRCAGSRLSSAPEAPAADDPSGNPAAASSAASARIARRVGPRAGARPAAAAWGWALRLTSAPSRQARTSYTLRGLLRRSAGRATRAVRGRSRTASGRGRRARNCRRRCASASNDCPRSGRRRAG